MKGKASLNSRLLTIITTIITIITIITEFTHLTVLTEAIALKRMMLHALISSKIPFINNDTCTHEV